MNTNETSPGSPGNVRALFLNAERPMPTEPKPPESVKFEYGGMSIVFGKDQIVVAALGNNGTDEKAQQMKLIANIQRLLEASGVRIQGHSPLNDYAPHSSPDMLILNYKLHFVMNVHH